MTEQGILEPFQSLGAGAHVLQSERSGGLLLSPQRLFLLTLVRRTQLASTQCKLVGTALGTAWVCNLVFLLNLVTLPAQEGEPAHARGSAQKKKESGPCGQLIIRKFNKPDVQSDFGASC